MIAFRVATGELGLPIRHLALKLNCALCRFDQTSRQRPTVDLPQPDSPTSPSVSPLMISNDTPSTAR